jgi:hypothetical protein
MRYSSMRGVLPWILVAHFFSSARFLLVSLIGDKGYDNESFRVQLPEAEIDAVIPPLGSRTAEIAYDENAYGLRYRIECTINKIKHDLRIATRYEKTAFTFFSMLCLAGVIPTPTD